MPVRPRWLELLRLRRDVLLLLLLLRLETRRAATRRRKIDKGPLQELLLLCERCLDAERVKERELQLLLLELAGGDGVRRRRPHADDGLSEAVEHERARRREETCS